MTNQLKNRNSQEYIEPGGGICLEKWREWEPEKEKPNYPYKFFPFLDPYLQNFHERFYTSIQFMIIP